MIPFLLIAIAFLLVFAYDTLYLVSASILLCTALIILEIKKIDKKLK